MSRRPKFKPEITRVKLNPEQAVLACACYNTNYSSLGANKFGTANAYTVCDGSTRATPTTTALCGTSGSPGRAQAGATQS